MRINKFVAQRSGIARRKADELISQGRVTVNGRNARLGESVTDSDVVCIDGEQLGSETEEACTLILNKPVGYVCSRDGQGSKTVYELLPSNLAYLKPVGRLDKDSSGLLIMSSDGALTQKLTHPKHHKQKVYEVNLNKPLSDIDQGVISEKGVLLEDGISRFDVSHKAKTDTLLVIMHEGRNRQIRRTFSKLGYYVSGLHRIKIGEYTLGSLGNGEYKIID